MAATRKTAKPAGTLLAASELPRRSVLADSTYEAVKQLIMDNRLVAGARISMDGLARDLDVSPTPVREALARLDAEGLVTRRPLVGYTVSPLLDVDAFEDLYGLRLLLEPQAARLAATTLAPMGRREIAELARAMSRASRGRGYAAYREHIALDAGFHDAITQASGSPLLREAIGRLRAHLHLYRLHWRAAIAAEPAHEHDMIVAALATGDGEAAAEAMRAHLRASHDRLARFAEREPGEPEG